MKEIDVRGLACPKPVIETKKALKEDDKLLVLIDSEVVKNNVIKLAQKLNCKVNLLEEGNEYRLTIEKTAANVKEEGEGNGKVYFISSDKLGKGKDELGELLIKGFISTLIEMDPLPDKIIFINSGVKVPTVNEEAREHLQSLEEAGVTILSCGTCLNYYGLEDKLEVGSISNMYEILESLNQGDVVSV
ncbi:sulfurtransferase-like selenium metabolism protein YedF [Halocella sp. SP3-1]|uniref:sulfurtransferase-like selenium metabolism protein YedF n=1 Tax=Halocella sp. SP3-1 TaxID=2382161 RepID=UPI000F7582E2|nr:sulfurtransferase-like selenium metabolism protein YedF [Halocella sp. SP3-1]AZO94718.1 sulfurtransferase-like selenium metabolism protein YedF [Halocella sp. SP3-1]